ncbi:MAG: hypothetical protein SGJ00_04400 [bacterium]|nr:hypothetical protein [bacterium]
MLLLGRLQLKLHIKICGKCGSYEKQSAFIDDVLKNSQQAFDVSNKINLPESTKARIQQEIDGHLK